MADAIRTLPASGPGGDTTIPVSTKTVTTVNGAGVAAQAVEHILQVRSTGADAVEAVDPANAANQATGNASLASIDGKLPALVGGRVPVTTDGAVTVTGGATEAKQDAEAVLIGAVNETAPGTDTANSGLNGRLQRIAQRLTSILTALGSPFQAGGSIGNTSFASTVADGANVVEGAVADAAVAAGGAGTLSAKLRAISRDLVSNVVLAAGANVIGAVTQSGSWVISAITTITNPVSTKTALTAAAPTAASVGVTTAQAVAAAATRKGLTLINTSVNRISLGFGAAAVLDSGITLYPGGSFVMDEYTFHVGAVNAIASGASSNMAVQEYTT